MQTDIVEAQTCAGGVYCSVLEFPPSYITTHLHMHAGLLHTGPAQHLSASEVRCERHQLPNPCPAFGKKQNNSAAGKLPVYPPHLTLLAYLRRAVMHAATPRLGTRWLLMIPGDVNMAL